MMDLPDTLPGLIPVFPLPGALLLPRALLPLQIFEPRYLAMLEDCLKTPHRLIGMIQPDHSGSETLYKIGCAGRVTQFAEIEGGRYMITLSGVSRFEVMREVQGFPPYRRCEVAWDGFSQDRYPACENGFDRSAFMMRLSRYLAARELESDWQSLNKAPDEILINSLCVMLEFSADEKQALLEAADLNARHETLSALMEYALRGSDGGVMQ